jgi:hypothetical protein
MDRYDTARRRQARPGRSALGYWLPLLITVTIATAGLAAWIWSERQHDNDDDDNNDRQDDTYDHPEEIPQAREQAPDSADQGFLSRVTGRTPSPQQLSDSASQRIPSAVGLSGSSAAGKQEAGGDPAFSDNEHWNEEAETKRCQRPPNHAPNKPKRTVVVVLNGQGQEDGLIHNSEHAVSFLEPDRRKMLIDTT